MRACSSHPKAAKRSSAGSLRREIDQKRDEIALSDETIDPRLGELRQRRQVNELKLNIFEGHHAHGGAEGREGVLGDLGLGVGDRS
jgi:hypothetical protein